MSNSTGQARKATGRKGGPPGSGIMQPVEKPKNFKKTFKRLLSYLKKYRITMLTVFFMSILATAFNIASPRIMGLITTHLYSFVKGDISQIDFSYISSIIILLIGLYGLASLFTYLQSFLMAGVSQKLVYDLREEINHKLQRLPLSYYDKSTTGEILSRASNDVDTISSTLQQSVVQLATAIITIVGVFIMMLLISPLITLVSLITIPLSIILTRVIAKKSQVFFKEQAKALGELNGQIEESFTGHVTIKAFGQEENQTEQFKSINEKLYNHGWKAQMASGIIMPLMQLINNIGYVFVAVVGGAMVIRGNLAIGNLQAFIQYARQFTQPIVQTAEIINVFQSTVASAERVFELLDEKEQQADLQDSLSLNLPKGSVEFIDVKFGYSKEKPLMKGLNIKLKQGDTVAIVGPTGAGKTTLVNLLMRFYELDGGKITIDETDIQDMRRDDLRELFGMVLQDTWLFKGTIKENIAYGKEGATEEEIIRAAKLAQADHFIRTLPDGYETMLNEDATNISQGQKQLLTIARAMLKDPMILILDEATSSVDTRTELLIRKGFDELMKGRTSFVIAHRLSTIVNAEEILVMNEGSIIEKGTHKELLEKQGFYADLYNSQFVG